MTRVACLLVLVVLSGSPAGRGEDRPPDAAKSIAVLDFVNRNPADGRDWLGKGLGDMVITDLSASRQLTVVDRQRVQDLVREIDLGAAGILDPKTAPQVGQIAKVRSVLFGTFVHHGADLSIEALLIDVAGGQAVRIEQVEGPASNLFDLEQTLVRAILAKLDVPMTEEESRGVRLLKTQSLPAFEHHARSLGLFDQGQWFEALREARLARRADPAYLAAAIRVAQLFYDVGEPEHAVIEYRRFVQQDRGDKLPADVYLALGKILEQAFADRAGAITIFQRLIRRDSQYAQPFRITDPARPSHNMDDLGGISNVQALFQEHKARLEALERLARWQLEAGQEDDAARLYGQLWHFLGTHGLSMGAGFDFSGLHARVREKYGPLYWRLVLENRDATFYPPVSLHLLSAENEVVGPGTVPTHGYYQWIPGGTFPVWLAPPDREIAEVSFSLEDDGSHIPEGFQGKAQIDFICQGYPSLFREMLQVKPDGTWHTLKLSTGIRALQTHVFQTNRWQVKFSLRPWSEPARIPTLCGYQVNILPPVADLYVNGKRHDRIQQGRGFSDLPAGRYEVEARWPDGRRRSAVLQLTRGRHGRVFLNANVNVLSRQVLAPDGSNTYLLTDRTGRIWLLWDQVCRDNDIMHLNAESNLFCVTSSDGINWSPPRRMPVSSLDCDTTPILQQDRRGVFWLVWVSSRDPQAPKSLWIASSPNGVEWSFPRKIVLPETEKDDLARWRSTHLPRPAFAIDSRNVFWLVWQGWLMRSEDARHWQIDSLLQTGEKSLLGGDNTFLKGHHLFRAIDGLLLVADFRPKDNSQTGPMLWHRGEGKQWESLGYLNPPPKFTFGHAGSAAGLSDGTTLTVTGGNAGLFVREFMADGSKSEPLCVESYLTGPFHPSVAPLPDGRFLVAFGSTDGLVVSVLQKDTRE